MPAGSCSSGLVCAGNLYRFLAPACALRETSTGHRAFVRREAPVRVSQPPVSRISPFPIRRRDTDNVKSLRACGELRWWLTWESWRSAVRQVSPLRFRKPRGGNFRIGSPLSRCRCRGRMTCNTDSCRSRNSRRNHVFHGHSDPGPWPPCDFRRSQPCDLRQSRQHDLRRSHPWNLR